MRLLHTSILSGLSLLSVLPLSAQKARPDRTFTETLVSCPQRGWKYGLGQPGEVWVQATVAGESAEGLMVRCTSRDSEPGSPATSSDTEVRNGLAKVVVGTRRTPGFRECDLELVYCGDTLREQLSVAFMPEDIEPASECPADFDEFWKRALWTARQTPLDPQCQRVDSLCYIGVDVYKVRLTVGPAGRHMYGWLSVPTDGRRHPVLLTPPGAGVKQIRYSDAYARLGYVHLAIEIHGLDPDMGAAEFLRKHDELEPYPTFGMEKPDTYYYKDVFAGCVRCLDYLCERPEWDGVNVGVTGGSQGGALSLVCAALHEKVTFASVFYPALCDPAGGLHGRTPGWPRFFADKPAYKRTVRADDAKATLPYFDVVNFARRVRVPVMLNYGHADRVCPPASIRAAYNALPGDEKRLVLTPTSAHWRFAEIERRSREWMRKHWQ